MAENRAAGIHSGHGGSFLDSGKPFSGVVRDTLHRDPPRLRTPAALCATGDARHCDVLGHVPGPSHQTGAMPKPGSSFQQVCIPGYGGHIAGKAAENVHGKTFGAANEHATHLLPLRQMRRVVSAPDYISAAGTHVPRGHSVAPRVPGYAGVIPGKNSESVHAKTFAVASEEAKGLRESNPHVTSDGWLRPGQWPGDRMATYNWNNRFMRADGHRLFTEEQDQLAYDTNRSLGQTFGLKPPKHNVYQPGDRFLHSLCKRAPDKEVRLDPAKQPAAGQPTHSIHLDGQRKRMHYTLSKGR